MCLESRQGHGATIRAHAQTWTVGGVREQRCTLLQFAGEAGYSSPQSTAELEKVQDAAGDAVEPPDHDHVEPVTFPTDPRAELGPLPWAGLRGGHVQVTGDADDAPAACLAVRLTGF